MSDREKKDRHISLQQAYRQGRDLLDQAGVVEADLDAWELLEYVSGIDRTHYYMDPGRFLTEEQWKRYRSLMEKRADRIPLQHLTGIQWFMGLEFCVNEHVLIPRQDTETLVEEALKYVKEKQIPQTDGRTKVLDLCTGSGCILLSILALTDGELDGIGSDISGQALAVAEKNAGKLHIEKTHVQFVQSDLFENITGRYGMILSNPPYIPENVIRGLEEEVRCHDPYGALCGGKDGLDFYRRISAEAGEFLEEGGILLVEIGHDQGKAVSALFEKDGYSEVTVKQDLAGRDRVVAARKKCS